MPVEGERADEPTAGSLARDDVVTCGLADTVGAVRARVSASPYPFAIVTSELGVVLGRLPLSRCDCDDDERAEAVMEPGPSTVRPHKTAATIAETLGSKGLRWAIVTTPEGELIGIAARSELEAAAA